MASNGMDCSPAAAEERWLASPLWLAMVDALAACGLAGKERDVAHLSGTDTNDPAWPHPDRAVRDRFHAEWTQRVDGFARHEEWSEAARARIAGVGAPAAPSATRAPIARTPSLTAVEREAICVRYRNGETGESLAECFEVSKDLIYKTLDAAGVPRRVKWAHHAEARRAKMAEAVAHYRPGMTLRALAAHLGCQPDVASRYLRDAGVTFDLSAAKSAGGRNRWARVRAGIHHQEAA